MYEQEPDQRSLKKCLLISTWIWTKNIVLTNLEGLAHISFESKVISTHYWLKVIFNVKVPYVFSFCSSWFGPGTRRPWLVKAKAVALLCWPGSNSGDARWFHEKFVNFAPQMKWRLVGWLDTLGRTVLPMGAAAVKVAKSTVMSEGARSRSQGKWAIALCTAIQSKAKSPTSFFQAFLGKLPKFWTWLVYDPNYPFHLKLYTLLC